MSKCPCGNSKTYNECCGLYISGKEDPPTAEALMRARYSSYVKNKVDFIIDSHVPDMKEKVSFEQTKKWALESNWHELTIINKEKGKESDTEGSVEFKAIYSRKGIKNIHHEVAQFKKIDNKWYFKSGKLIPTTIIRDTDKVGRNDPCSCGSGKKYKKCCINK